MTALLALALALPLWNVDAWALDESPTKTAFLWVPESSFSDWEGLGYLMYKFPDARWTMAVAAEEIPPQAQALLMQWAKEGRLELALRVPGDPILPLIGKYRIEDVPYRIAAARQRHRQAFGQAASGLVPGGGALTMELARLLQPQGLQWAAVGTMADPEAAAWPSVGNMTLVPFEIAAATSSRAIRTVVLDGTNPPSGSSGLESLEKLLEKDSAGKNWITLSQALVLASTFPALSETWQTWTGNYFLWSGPSQNLAWQRYAKVLQLLNQYQNSGRATLSTLNKAQAALHTAQGARFYRLGALTDTKLEQEHRSLLEKVCKLIGHAAPRELHQPISMNPMAISEGDLTPEERVQSGAGPNSLWFENRENSTVDVPELLPELAEGTTAQDLWDLREFRAAWDERAVTFAFKLRKTANPQQAPLGFSVLMLDLYIDLNRMAGRGSIHLLPGRKGFLQSIDAWEYVLVLTGWGGGLYRYEAQGPVLIQPLAPRLEGNSIMVSVTRSVLRGNPAAWGYLPLALSAGPEVEPGLSPPLPLMGRQGSPILGLLEALKATEAEPRPNYRRFSAWRVEK